MLVYTHGEIMIKSLFEESQKKMNTIINQHHIVANIVYQLSKDLNTKTALSNLIDNCSNYDTLERMAKYHLNKDILALNQIIGSLLQTMKSVGTIKDKTGKEIAKPCLVFNDNIGKTTLRLLSHLPLLRLMSARIKYEEMNKNKDGDPRTMEVIADHKNGRLFDRECFTFKEFPDDADFEELALKKKVYQERAKHYESEVKSELDDNISKLCVEPSNRVDFGAAFWDIQSQPKVNNNALKETIEAMCASFQSEKQEKLDKLIAIFKSELDIDGDVNIDVNKLNTIIINTANELGDAKMTAIQKFWMLKKDFEITSIAAKHMCEEDGKFEYSFSCSIEL